MRDVLLASIDLSHALPRPDGCSRLVRAAYVAVHVIGWKVQLREQPRARSRDVHLFQRPLVGATPDLTECSTTANLLLPAGLSKVAHDLWSGWGGTIAHREAHVYTDGSYDSNSLPHSTSSWAVTVRDRWLVEHFATVPVDEKELAAHPAHSAGAIMFGASIMSTRGVYPAELQAIARSIAMFPLHARCTCTQTARLPLLASVLLNSRVTNDVVYVWQHVPCCSSSNTC